MCRAAGLQKFLLSLRAIPAPLLQASSLAKGEKPCHFPEEFSSTSPIGLCSTSRRDGRCESRCLSVSVCSSVAATTSLSRDQSCSVARDSGRRPNGKRGETAFWLSALCHSWPASAAERLAALMHRIFFCPRICGDSAYLRRSGCWLPEAPSTRFLASPGCSKLRLDTCCHKLHSLLRPSPTAFHGHDAA